MKKRMSHIRAEMKGKRLIKPRRSAEQIKRDEQRKAEAQKRLSDPNAPATRNVEIEYMASSSGGVAVSNITIPAAPWES